jgi:outer membrane protein TolC
MLTRLDLSRAASDQRAAIGAEKAAEREEVSKRSGVARTLGIPTTVPLQLSDSGGPDCAGEPREELQRIALGTRWPVRRAAAEYQVAEGDLRIEVANATPNLSIGPGLFFDQGTGKFTLGGGLPSLALNRNRGPIGEAEARRTLAGARLMQAQETVLAEVDAALSACENVGRQAEAADSLTKQAESRLRLMQAAYARGETGRLELITAQLEMVRVHRATTEAALRKGAAGLGLERAVGAWGTRADGPWPVPIK